MNILVMWSGGIDSTYRLAKLLAETTHHVHAHHIHIVNHEGRVKAEEAACKTLMPKLQAIRSFTWSQSVVDHSNHPVIPHDVQIVCFEAGVVVRAAAHQNNHRNFFRKWTIGTHAGEGHDWTRWVEIYPAFKAAAYPLKELPEFELFPLVSKRDEIDYLRRIDLLRHCWYCRTPVLESKCGKCKTCEEVKNASI